MMKVSRSIRGRWRSLAVLIAFAVVVLAASIAPALAVPSTINVNGTGWWRVGGTFNASDTPIQHAIDNATAGDTINVVAGTYLESIVMPYFAEGAGGLTVQSTTGAATTIIDCGGVTQGVQIVSNAITFSGFTVKNASNLINQISGNDHNLNNLILTDFVNYGMSVLAAYDCTFSDITIHGSDVGGGVVKGIDIQEYGSGGNTNNQFEGITIHDIETTGTGSSIGIFFEGDNPDTHPTTGNTFSNVDIYDLASEDFNCGVYILDMGGAYTPVHSFIDPYAIEDTTFTGGNIYGFTESDGDVVSRGFYVKGGNKNLDVTGFDITGCDEGFYFRSFTGTIPPTFPPAGWTTINNNSDAYEWEVSDYSSGLIKPHGGSYYAVMDTTSVAGDDYLITPQQSITTPGHDDISFWASSNAFSATVYYDLMVSTTGTDWDDFSVHTSDSVTMGFPGNEYTLKTYDLSTYNGQNIYIAIHANEPTPASDKKLRIDDVNLPDGSTQGFEGTPTTIGAVDVSVNFNNIYGNTDYGVDNNNTLCIWGGIDTIDATYNWWGDASGPEHHSDSIDCKPPDEGGWNCDVCDENPDGLGDKVSDNVDYCPWLGAELEETESETFDGAGTMTNTPTGGNVTIEATGNHTVTTVKYEDNPGGAPTFQATGDYWDVHLDNSTGVTGITVEFCPANPEDTIYYWNDTTASWEPCSDQAFADGCITVTITGDTEPSLEDLSGEEFGRGGPSIPVPDFSTTGLFAGIGMMCIMLAISVFRRRR